MPCDDIKEAVPILRALVELYQKANREKREELRIWADYALHWSCRRLEAFLPATKVSKAAKDKAAKMKIGDISRFTWDDQTQKGKMRDTGRKIFHYEHVYPVSQLRHDLEALNPPTDEAVYALVQKVDMVWILKEECARLDKAGYRSNRPLKDLWRPFREVGIEMDGK